LPKGIALKQQHNKPSPTSRHALAKIMVWLRLRRHPPRIPQSFKICIRATLSAVSRNHNIPIDVLEKEYSKINSIKTASAFTDGKISDDYRKERFPAVLATFHIKPTPEYLNELAATYISSLQQELQLKPEATNLLSYLISIGKRILIISEGPQDAQEWTIETLELEHHFLATTNFFGVSNVNGLFERVLNHLQIDASDLVFIRDNVERDVEPA
jgi:putative hydrolase of the HAD superfamily